MEKMIYLLAIALILTVAGFVIKARQKGALTIILDAAIAIVFGFLAGIIIGVGARFGMWAVAVANGAEPSFSASGTLRVVATFACFGIVFGLIYEGLLRSVLGRRGLIFGILITIVAIYPTAEAVADTLAFQPTALSLFFFSGVGAALMFVPFAIVLERLLRFWHRRDEILVASESPLA